MVEIDEEEKPSTSKDKDTGWTWEERMPKFEAYLREIGATDSSTWKPEPKPKAIIRDLTPEELAVWKAERAASEARMQEWEAKRKIEMAEEARVKAEKEALENPPKPVLPKKALKPEFRPDAAQVAGK
jgi:hypothetical protein